MKSAELASRLGGCFSGRTDVELVSVSSIKLATPTDVVFAENQHTYAEAVQSRAGMMILSREMLCPDGRSTPEGLQADGRARLFTEQPRLAFSLASCFLASDAYTVHGGVHPTAVVSQAADVGEALSVGAQSVIEQGVRLGAGVSIGANCTIMRDVEIGEGTIVQAGVTIYPRVRVGRHCHIQAGAVLGAEGFGYVRNKYTGGYTKFPQMGELIIGDRVDVGANTTIDRGALEATVIGDGVKIDNLVHIGHNVQIGKNVVIAAQTGISGSSVIGEGAVIAGQVGIADHVTIGEGAILGAQCGVPTRKKISGPGVLFWGTPARPIQQYLKELAAVSRLVKKPKKD